MATIVVGRQPGAPGRGNRLGYMYLGMMNRCLDHSMNSRYGQCLASKAGKGDEVQHACPHTTPALHRDIVVSQAMAQSRLHVLRTYTQLYQLDYMEHVLESIQRREQGR